MKNIHISRAICECVLEQIKDQRKILQKMEENAREELDKKILEACPELNDGEFFFYLQGWECEKSPITLCVYKYDGMGEDECIFCGKSEERK